VGYVPTPADDPLLHIGTEALRADLGRRSLRSGLLRLTSQAIRLAVLIGSGAVLARLLTPADFGLMAMVATLVALVETLRETGLPMVIVHRDDLDHEQVSALFWISLRVKVGTTVLMMAMAPAIAWFYDEPRLIAMTLLLAAGLFAFGLSTFHQSLLVRRMQFRRLTAVELGSQFAGVATAIVAAVLGAGYWALVGQVLTEQVTMGVAMWQACGWRPAPAKRREGPSDPRVKAMLLQGAHITGFDVITYFGQKLDSVLIGYFSGATALGLYANAYRWSLYPVHQMYTPLVKVAVASLSRLHTDPVAYRRSCRLGLLPTFSVVMPALAFLFVEAGDVIDVLLGDQWAAAVPIFRVLVVAAFAASVLKVLRWLYLSEGRAQEQLRWALTYTPVMVLAVVIGMRWGAYGVAVGVAVGNSLLVLPGIRACLRTSPLPVGDFLAIVSRPALASLIAAAVLLACRGVLTLGHNQVFDLGLRFTVFLLAYAALWLGLPGGRQDATQLLRILRIIPARAPSSP